MKVAVLQIPSPKSPKELNAYLDIAQSQKVKVLLFGEYFFNPFFKEIKQNKSNQHLSKIKKSYENLINLSENYSMVFVAPILEVIGTKIYKSILVINQGKVLKYYAQKLISYEHWDEEAFFSNKQVTNIEIPPIFSIGGFKFSVLFGYELHFDEFWLKFKKENVDCVFLPTASTFDSSLRWRNIIKMRAFLNSCYILRANKIGQYQDEMSETLWNFYGDSLLANPEGEIEDCLEDREGLLICNLNKKYLKEVKECWKFR